MRKSLLSGSGPWRTVLDWSVAAAPATTEIRIALGLRHADGTLQTDADRTVVAKLSLEIFVNRAGGRNTGGGWVSKGSRGSTAQLWWDNVLAVDPFDPDVWLTGEQELYRTEDSGDTWATVASYYAPHEDQQSVQFDPRNAGAVYLSNDGGVYRSSDGGLTWYVASISVAAEIAARRSLVRDLATAEFYRVGVQGNMAVGNLFHSGIIASDDLARGRWHGIEGHAWEFNYIYADPKRAGRFYVFHSVLAIRRYPGAGTPDDFVTIAPFRPYLQGADTSNPVGAIAIDRTPGSGAILVGAFPDPDGSNGYRLMMTVDGDLEPRLMPDGTVVDQPAWTVEVDNGLDPIVSVEFAPSEPTKAYAASASGSLFSKTVVVDPGPWQNLGSSGVRGVRQIAINPLHSERLYLIANDAFARSEDGGHTWPPVGSAPTSELNSIACDPRFGTRLYLGADIGVFVSDDEGETWSPFDIGLPNAEVLQIFVTAGYLYAVTHGRGLWRRLLC